jgi:hypothetical protein
VLNAKLTEKASELDGKVQPSVGMRNFDDVEEEGEGVSVLLEMNGERGIGTVVR